MSMPVAANHSFLVADQADVTAAVMLVPKLALLSDGAETERYLIATIVSELGSNIVKYAGRGLLRLSRNEQNGNVDIEIWAEDTGPGIPDTERAMTDHYSTGGTLGLGLPGVRRMADQFQIVSTSGEGTRILARKRIRGERQARAAELREWTLDKAEGLEGKPREDGVDWDVGTSCRALAGQRWCGDATVVAPAGNSLMLAIIDASGHGERAHEVAEMAASLIRRLARARIEAILEQLETELRGTPGAAVGLLAIHRDSGVFRYAGVGNTRAAKIGVAAWRGVSRDGVLGNHSRSALVQRGTLEPGDILALWTDGLPESATTEMVRSNSFQQASAIAQLLVRNLGRRHDDAGCLVLKWRR